MNIMYCGDKNSFDGILMSILSITRFDEDINFYILSADLSYLNKRFQIIDNNQINYLNSINKNINVRLLDCTEIFIKYLGKNKNLDTKYTPYTLLRLLIANFHLNVDKILYLDTDIIAIKSIKELYDIDITNYEIAMVKDHMGQIFINHNYCNAGVMLINLNKCIETNLFNKCIEVLNAKKLSYPDQDAIHRCIKNKLILPKKYNEQRKIKNDTVIKHYCKGINWFPFYIYNVKPWNIDEFKSFYKTDLLDDLFIEFKKYKEEWRQ